MQRVILHCATLGGGGAVLFAFTLWSVRWKDDQRRSNRCILKPQKKNDVPNLYHCRAFISMSLEWAFSVGISCIKVRVWGK